jgi:DNA-directed RNA polymerase specialized sigma24 family protein
MRLVMNAEVGSLIMYTLSRLRGVRQLRKEENNVNPADIMPPIYELFNLCSDRAYSLALKMAWNKSDEEGLTQEVFIQLKLQADSKRRKSASTTCLHRLPINHVLTHFFKQQTR